MRQKNWGVFWSTYIELNDRINLKINNFEKKHLRRFHLHISVLPLSVYSTTENWSSISILSCICDIFWFFFCILFPILICFMCFSLLLFIFFIFFLFFSFCGFMWHATNHLANFTSYKHRTYGKTNMHIMNTSKAIWNEWKNNVLAQFKI